MRNPLSESAPGLAGLMQSVMDASARKEEKPGGFGANSSPDVRPRGMGSGRKKKPVLSPVNVSWDGDELDARIRAIEAAGEVRVYRSARFSVRSVPFRFRSCVTGAGPGER